MITASLLPCFAKYIGKTDRFINGTVYSVCVFIRQSESWLTKPTICVAPNEKTNYYIPYRSVRRMLRDWDFAITK